MQPKVWLSALKSILENIQIFLFESNTLWFSSVFHVLVLFRWCQIWGPQQEVPKQTELNWTVWKVGWLLIPFKEKVYTNEQWGRYMIKVLFRRFASANILIHHQVLFKLKQSLNFINNLIYRQIIINTFYSIYRESFFLQEPLVLKT